ncbi:MAG: DUF5752 family protein [Gammaproteobacteria bacterium]|jgi:hypothetical protein|nr:DUF5752 family protein [Gammaproteobacteria bacterium]
MSARAGSIRKATPFKIKDCALVAMATGRRARLMPEFRREIATVPVQSIYHHFWGGLLQPRFEEREYNNDFAAWMRHSMHDAVLAERLAALDPTSCPELEALRREMLELIDNRLDEVEYLSWARASIQFEFLSSQIVIFDTGRTVSHPAELAENIGHLSTSSIFYHFIDARRRVPEGNNDFTLWMQSFGRDFEPLCASLTGVDPYFGSITELRQKLATIFQACVREHRS